MRLFAVAGFALALTPGLAAAAPLAASLGAPPPTPAAHAPDAVTAGAVRVAVRQEMLPAGGRMADHRPDGLRYLYVISGRLKVSNLVTGAEELVDAGKIAAETAGDWHAAEAVGADPATFYVIDQASDATN